MDIDRRLVSCRRVCATVLILAIVAAPVSLRAQDVTLQNVGGNGGNPYTVDCGQNALVGLHGQPGTNILGQAVVFYLNVYCVGLNADGSWDGAPTIAGATIGTVASNFPTVDMMCPAHTAISGIKGRAAGYVSDIEVVCTTIGPGGLLTGSPKPPATSAGVSQIAGSGILSDPSYGLFQCTSNYPGKGLTGRAHDWVDRIALICGIPHVKQVTVSSVSLQKNKVVGGGTVSGTVTLNAPAPANVAVDFHLPPNSHATTPASLFYTAGQQTASFVLTTSPTPSMAIAHLSATVFGSSSLPMERTIEIDPPAIAGLSLTPSYVHAGTPVTGKVTLTGPAYSGLTVSLFTGDATVATLPSTVAVALRDTIVTFPIRVVAGDNACTYIDAGLGNSAARAYLAVEAPAVAASRTAMKFPLRLSGQAALRQLTLTVPSSNTPTVVSLTSSNPAILAVPATVTVPAQTTSVGIGMTITNSYMSESCVTITAHDATTTSNVLIFLLNGTVISAVIG